MISFVESVLTQLPEVEAIAKCHLNYEKHPYLVDHNYKGAMIMPTVFGLEAMSQVMRMTLNPIDKELISSQNAILVVENIKLTRPIPVSSKGVDIEIYAEVDENLAGLEETRIRCGIRCALTGYAHDHFKAEFVLNQNSKILPVQVDLPVGMQKQGSFVVHDLGISPKKDLYGSILFQGPRFQQIHEIYYLESDNENHGKIFFSAQTTPDAQKHFTLGDPYFRDCLLQSAQLIIPQNQCLPIEIARLEIYPNFFKSSPRFIFTEVHKIGEKTYQAEITVLDIKGDPLQRLRGYRLQLLEKKPELPRAMDLLKSALTKTKVHVPERPNFSIVRDKVPQNRDLQLLEPYKIPFELLRIDAKPGGPQNQAVFVHRFIPDFKTFACLGNGIYFSHIFNWMGLARELSSIPVLAEIRRLTESGKWGQVTNWANIEVFGECRNEHRIVEARMWCGKLGGAKKSSATLSFDWVSMGPHGPEERIARGQMGFTWVEILAHGVVQPAPLPASYGEFIKTMEAQNDLPNSYEPLAEPYRALSPGPTLFKASGGNRSIVPLALKTYETTLFDANLVGNLYFANYSVWMGRTRDSFFHALNPRYFTKSIDIYELLCTRSHIQHLREAMPFDTIQVAMGLRHLSKAGIELQFEFFRKNADGSLDKLAIAEHQVLWIHQSQQGTQSADWPEDILGELLKRIHEHGIELSAS